MSPPKTDGDDMDRLADRNSAPLIVDLFHFLSHNKKWWLLPLLLILGLFGILTFLASSGVAPFIYSL